MSEETVSELQAEFQKVQDVMKQAAQSVQDLLGADDVPPPAAKARYEAITKIEEAYMWVTNGVQSLIHFGDKVEAAAQSLAPEVAATGKPSLKVVK